MLSFFPNDYIDASNLQQPDSTARCSSTHDIHLPDTINGVEEINLFQPNILQTLRPKSSLQLMFLLPTSQLPKLLLRNARHEPLHATKNLRHALSIHSLPIRLPNEGLNSRQTGANKMRAEPILDLLEDQLLELLILALLRLKDLIHEPDLQQLLGRDALTHDQRLIGLGYTQSLHESARSEPFAHEPDRGEGRQEEGVRHGVDEIGEGDQGGGEADCGPVERGDEDLGVCVECVRDV